MGDEVIRTLLASADPGFCELITLALGPGFVVCCLSANPTSYRSKDGSRWDVILLDCRTAEDGAGLSRRMRLVERLKQADLLTPVVALVRPGDDDRVRALIGKGVFDTLGSLFRPAELRLMLRRAHRVHQVELEWLALRRPLLAPGRLGDLIGFTEVMTQTFELARKVAACDVGVVITGEAGTGKGLLARAIHQLSSRSSGPFVRFSCANLSTTLMDDELFGHEKGAFTGAVAQRRGRFEMADSGTLFIDGIGELAWGLQSKLLRFLQQRAFERVGSNTPITTNVRILCATPWDLERQSRRGLFRADLYYRLNVVQIRMPALRERRADIPVLARHFLAGYGKQFQRTFTGFSASAMRVLEEYPWPGNVCELENAVQRAAGIAEGPTVEAWHLPDSLSGRYAAASGLS